MNNLQENIDLTSFTTMATPAKAQWYVEINERTEIPTIIETANNLRCPVFILGGGSNLVLAPVVKGVVARNHLMGKEVLSTTSQHVLVEVGAGENWHDFVTWCVTQDLSGMENLALIPGTVGAAPVQNIGAYGVEISSLVDHVQAYDTAIQQFVSIDNEDCCFRYRDSLFKDHEGRYIITAVVFKLNRQLVPNLSYGPLKALEQESDLNVKSIVDAVIAVRTEKLPDPRIIPNAGSFFKNPILSREQFKPIFNAFPEIVNYPTGDQVKLAAGWLIDQAGLKGQANDCGVGCYEKQALVVINPNHADGDAILGWADTVMQRVFDQFGVQLEIEPRVWR